MAMAAAVDRFSTAVVAASVSGGRSSSAAEIVRLDGSAVGGPHRVERAIAHDRGRPAAKVIEVAGEARQVSDDLRPGLSRHIFGVLADEARGVPEQTRLRVEIEPGERGLVAGLGRGDCRLATVLVGCAMAARRIGPSRGRRRGAASDSRNSVLRFVRIGQKCSFGRVRTP